MVLIQPCKTTAAYEAIPERDLGLDLGRLEGDLVARGWQPVANAGILLVVRKRLETSIFQSGKLLIKTRNRVEAEAVWSELAPSLEAATHGR